MKDKNKTSALKLLMTYKQGKHISSLVYLFLFK